MSNPKHDYISKEYVSGGGYPSQLNGTGTYSQMKNSVLQPKGFGTMKLGAPQEMVGEV
jgi:hypothetical protein